MTDKQQAAMKAAATALEGLIPLSEKMWNYLEKARDRSIATITPDTARFGDLRFVRQSNVALQLLRDAGDGWEAISDKHRDGEKWLLVDDNGHRLVARWAGFYWLTVPGSYDFKPTHAMPLPLPPQTPEGK